MKTDLIPGPLYASPLLTTDGRELPTTGGAVCDWIEANCVLGEGDYYGEPVVLRPFQRRFIYRLYEYYPETKRRRYKRALLGMGKGNGKSPIVAAVGAYELAGGRNAAPRVIIGAASLKQSNVVFGDLRAMTSGPDDRPSPLRPFLEFFDQRILLKGQQGVAERIAAEAGTNDGARATAFLADELHEWEGRKGRVFLVVEGAIAKRKQGFTLSISTAGVLGVRDEQGVAEAVLERMYDHGKLVAMGAEVDDGFLFEWYEAPTSFNLEALPSRNSRSLRLPAPTRTGWTQSRISSKRPCCSSVRATGPNPNIRMSWPGSSLILVTSSTRSPSITVELVQSAFFSVVEATYFFMLLILSA